MVAYTFATEIQSYYSSELTAIETKLKIMNEHVYFTQLHLSHMPTHLLFFPQKSYIIQRYIYRVSSKKKLFKKKYVDNEVRSRGGGGRWLYS